MAKHLKEKNLTRWRLVLGKYASKQLPVAMGVQQQRIEKALDYLYSREYEGRGIRGASPSKDRTDSLDPTQLTIPRWLSEVRDLFPQETIETIEKHALDRYGMQELVTDKKTLETLEPNMDLLKMILTFRGHIKGDLLSTVRRIIRQVVEDLKNKLAKDVRQVMAGKLNRVRTSPLKIAQNFDWRGTLQANLKNYDPSRKQVVLETLRFFSRSQRRMAWEIILCIDQSGSMAGSVIHSAVMAGILSGLPLLKIKLVIFDTSVVDLSGYADDPVEVLMNVQLGGGTDIGQAMSYCEQLVEIPRRTVLVLISDFCEGASPKRLLSSCHRLKEAGVTLIGLAALDEQANTAYDVKMAERLAAEGMDIAALTPQQLAEWLIKIIS
jgi:Mg-chelatase subunit ChlD